MHYDSIRNLIAGGNPVLHLSQFRLTWYFCFSAVFFCCVFTSCVTTRFKETPPCSIALESDCKLLLHELPKEDEEFLLKGINAKLEKRKVSLDYFPSQEWNLKAAGITNAFDAVHFGKLKKLGYTHFLFIKELSNRSESSYVYYTSEELKWEDVYSAYKPSWNELGNQSEVIIQLIPIGDLNGRHNVVVKTTIGHLIVKDKNEGETYVNPSSVRTARNKAILRGIKKLLQDCKQ